MSPPLLQLDKATIRFGGLTAVNAVDFVVNEDELVGLIGPNGAGKTTVFNLITGVYKHDVGTIRFGTKDLKPLKPAQIAAAGIGRTFQNIRLFAQLTVLENLLVACELTKRAHLMAAIFRLPVHYEDERAMEATYEMRVTTDADHRDAVRGLMETQLEAVQLPVRGIAVLSRPPDSVELVATLMVHAADPGELDRAALRLRETPFVSHASWMVASPD